MSGVPPGAAGRSVGAAGPPRPAALSETLDDGGGLPIGPLGASERTGRSTPGRTSEIAVMSGPSTSPSSARRPATRGTGGRAGARGRRAAGVTESAPRSSPSSVARGSVGTEPIVPVTARASVRGRVASENLRGAMPSVGVRSRVASAEIAPTGAPGVRAGEVLVGVPAGTGALVAGVAPVRARARTGITIEALPASPARAVGRAAASSDRCGVWIGCAVASGARAGHESERDADALSVDARSRGAVRRASGPAPGRMSPSRRRTRPARVMPRTADTTVPALELPPLGPPSRAAPIVQARRRAW